MPMSENLFARFRAQPWQDEKLFIRTMDGRALSYADVVTRSAQFAFALRTLGVRPGDRVVAQLEKSPEGLLLYFASLRAGAIYVPLNTAYTLAELEYFIGDAEPKVVVCAPERQASIAALVAELAGVNVVTLAA